MIRFGVFLAIIGFGSVGLRYMDYEFRILAWAEPMQPGIGVVIGVVGLMLIGIALLLKKNASQSQAVQPAPGQYPPGGPGPGQYPPGGPAGPLPQQPYADPGQAPQGYSPRHPQPPQFRP